MRVLVLGEMPPVPPTDINFAEALGRIVGAPAVHSSVLFDPDRRQRFLQDPSDRGWIVYGAEYQESPQLLELADGLIVFNMSGPSLRSMARWWMVDRAHEQGKHVAMLNTVDEASLVLRVVRDTLETPKTTVRTTKKTARKGGLFSGGR